MNLIRCSQGHFYDSEQYASCPYCEMPRGLSPSGDETVSNINWNSSQNTSRQTADDLDKTVSIFARQTEKEPGKASSGTKPDMVQPVVGWLVCVEGEDFGRDYRLIAGHNFIGRGPEMNVNIAGDLGISRSKHAILTYDPKQNGFFIQPGESHELCYLNGSVVLEHMQIKAYDVLGLGNTSLLFVPCCSAQFQWNYKKVNLNKEV